MRKNSGPGKKASKGGGKAKKAAATATPKTATETEAMEWEEDQQLQRKPRPEEDEMDDQDESDLEDEEEEEFDEDEEEEEDLRSSRRSSSLSRGSGNSMKKKLPFQGISNLPPSPFSLPPRMRIDQLALEGQGSEDDADSDLMEKKREQQEQQHKKSNKGAAASSTISAAKKKAARKPGIVYLSSIPAGYNVSMTTQFFSQFGPVGRVFLQPDSHEKAKSKDNYARSFTEGWIEFLSKRLAKDVAGSLNNTAVGGKKRNKAHGTLWNIKYLPRFKWVHLSERLAYETAVHQQKMRTEISKAKREADHFKTNLEKSKRQEKKASRKRAANSPNNATETKRQKVYEFRQKETDETIKKRKTDNKAGTAAAVASGSGPSGGGSSLSPPRNVGKSKGKKKNKAKGKSVQTSQDRSSFLQSVFSKD